LTDTAQEVRAILSRTLRELDKAIENPSVSSILSGLGSLLGVDDGDGTVAPAARASRTSGARASRRSKSVSASARGRRTASGARMSAPARGRRSPPATGGAKPREATKGSNGARKSSRRDDLLALVREQPGVTLAQAAARFGLKDSTGLYSVARRLQEEGLVRRAGPELHPTGTARKR
jgi:hypothetical protein